MKAPTFNQIIVLLALVAAIFIYLDNRKAIKSWAGSTITVVNVDSSKIYLPEQSYNFPPSNITVHPPSVIPPNIDSMAIVRAYFSEVHYRDSIENDTIKIYLNEIVKENRINSRELRWNLKLPVTTIISTHEEKKRNMLVVGGSVYMSRDTTAGIFLTGGLMNKRSMIYHGSWDPVNNRFGVGIMYPIKLRK